MPAVYAPPEVETDNAPDEPTTAVEVPFWQKYNSHFEFPSSVVLSVLTFVTLFAIIIGTLLLALAVSGQKETPKIIVVQGPDNEGDGSAGSGGADTPLKNNDALPTYSANPTVPNSTLPDVPVPEVSPNVPNPLAPGQLSDSSQTPLQKLVDELRNPKPGGKRGSGPGTGSGDAGQPGAGPGGSGNDSTHKRSLRWSLRFKTADGRDYVSQLAAMQAVMVVPQPPDEKDAFVFRDLRNPKSEKLGEADWVKLATQIQFIDTNPESVKNVAGALGLNFSPKRFMAFFPQSLEEDLARKETAYRGRRAEDIEETVFRVTVRAGAYDLVVESQKAKR